MVQTLTLKIKGMTCSACAQASERAVKKLEGVQEAAVNFATEKILVKFEDGKLSVDSIKGAIAKAGYEAADDVSPMKTATIPIGGMTCTACAKAIERAVGKLPGIGEASVNFATEKATVRYDSAKTRLSEIKASITKAGYTPLAVSSANAAERVDEHKLAKEREIRVLKAKLAVSALFSVPLFYIAMGAMLGWPLPASIAAMDYRLRYALLEIALVIPVLAAGWRFY